MKSKVFKSLFPESLGKTSLQDFNPVYRNFDQTANSIYMHPETDSEIEFWLSYGSNAEKMILSFKRFLIKVPPEGLSKKQVQGHTVTFISKKKGKVAIAFSLVDQFMVSIISNGNDNIVLLQTMLADYDLEALTSLEPPKSFNEHSLSNDICLSPQCFADRINACESGQFLAQLGRGRISASGLRGIYTVEESTKDGQCLLSFKFTNNPNPDYIDKKIFFSVEQNADVAENFKKKVLTPLMNCLEGSKEASKNCS